MFCPWGREAHIRERKERQAIVFSERVAAAVGAGGKERGKKGRDFPLQSAAGREVVSSWRGDNGRRKERSMKKKRKGERGVCSRR